MTATTRTRTCRHGRHWPCASTACRTSRARDFWEMVRWLDELRRKGTPWLVVDAHRTEQLTPAQARRGRGGSDVSAHHPHHPVPAEIYTAPQGDWSRGRSEQREHDDPSQRHAPHSCGDIETLPSSTEQNDGDDEDVGGVPVQHRAEPEGRRHGDDDRQLDWPWQGRPSPVQLPLIHALPTVRQRRSSGAAGARSSSRPISLIPVPQPLIETLPGAMAAWHRPREGGNQAAASQRHQSTPAHPSRLVYGFPVLRGLGGRVDE